MPEHEVAAQKGQQKADPARRLSVQNPQPLSQNLVAWDISSYLIGETPFDPPIQKHAALLSASTPAGLRAIITDQLQQTYGNQYVQRLIKSMEVQDLKATSFKIVSGRQKIKSAERTRSGSVQTKSRVTIGAGAETQEKAQSYENKELAEMFKMAGPGGMFTDTLVKALKAQPNKSLALILREVTEKEMKGQSPTLMETGTSKARNKVQAKFAVIITNADYGKGKYDTDLPEAINDGVKMNSALKARKYKVESYKNKEAKEMYNLYRGCIEKASAGSEVVLYYSGHGKPEGLEDVKGKYLSPQKIDEIKGIARAKEVDLTIIMDSCHSGSITDFVRMQEIVSSRKGINVSTRKGKRSIELLDIALEFQKQKNRLALFENTKFEIEQKLMQSKSKNLDKRISELDAEESKIWSQETLPKLQAGGKKFKEYTGRRYAIPKFNAAERYHSKELDALDTIINRIMNSAR